MAKVNRDLDIGFTLIFFVGAANSSTIWLLSRHWSWQCTLFMYSSSCMVLKKISNYLQLLPRYLIMYFARACTYANCQVLEYFC